MARVKFLGSAYLSEYHNNSIDGKSVSLKPGDVVEVSDAAASLLLSDFNGIFVSAEDEPRVDRQIKSAETRPISTKRAVKK